MPINTVKCPFCGARVNHTVKVAEAMDADFMKAIGCPRCKKQFSVNTTSLSSRTLEGVNELAAFDKQMSVSESEFEKAFGDDKGDSVERALDKADEVFGAAKRALDEISLEKAAQTIDADELLQQYSVPDVKQFAMGKTQQAVRKVQQRYGISDALADEAARMAELGYDAAARKAAEHLDNAVEKAAERGHEGIASSLASKVKERFV